MNIATIASRPVAIANRSDSLGRALQQMWLLRCEHLPVVERREGILRGMLSIRDILIHANENGYAAHELRHVDPKHIVSSTRVDEIMTSALITISPHEAVADAAKVMLRNKIHAIPLVQSRSLYGIVTETDLLKCFTEKEFAYLRPKEADDRLGDHIATNIFTVSEDDLPPAAVRIMRDKHIRHVPVVDDNGSLVGILSETDLLWGHNVAKADYFIKLPSRSKTHVRAAAEDAEVTGATPARAADLMNDKPLVLGVSATLSDAAGLMVSNSVGSVPVVENDRLVGIITSSDLVRALCQ